MHKDLQCYPLYAVFLLMNMIPTIAMKPHIATHLVSPVLRLACTVAVGKAGVVSVVSTTSGDASPLSPICVRPCVRPRLPHVGSTSSSSSSYGCCCCLHRRSPTSTPVTAATANGAASVASRPQGRELALKKTAFERRRLGEGDMLLLPSQTVDPAATATPYSDATQVGASY